MSKKEDMEFVLEHQMEITPMIMYTPHCRIVLYKKTYYVVIADIEKPQNASTLYSNAAFKDPESILDVKKLREKFPKFPDVRIVSIDGILNLGFVHLSSETKKVLEAGINYANNYLHPEKEGVDDKNFESIHTIIGIVKSIRKETASALKVSNHTAKILQDIYEQPELDTKDEEFRKEVRNFMEQSSKRYAKEAVQESLKFNEIFKNNETESQRILDILSNTKKMKNDVETCLEQMKSLFAIHKTVVSPFITRSNSFMNEKDVEMAVGTEQLESFISDYKTKLIPFINKIDKFLNEITVVDEPDPKEVPEPKKSFFKRMFSWI